MILRSHGLSFFHLSMTVQPNKSADITLQELLELKATSDATVRFICALRTVLLRADSLNDDECEIELDVSRMYHSLGWDRRKEAHDNLAREREERQREREGQEEQPQAVPVVITEEPRPSKPVLALVPAPAKIEYAPYFNPARCSTLAKQALAELKATNNSDEFTFSQLKVVVKKMHLEGGRHFKPQDSAIPPQSRVTRWEAVLQNELKRMRMNDVVFYRKTKGCYLILPE